MPAWVQTVTTFNTTAGAHTASITPATNGLLVVVASYTAGTRQQGSVTDNQTGGTYTKLVSSFQSAPRTCELFIRNSLCANAAHTVTQADPPGSDTGGGLCVLEFSGFTTGGSVNFRQSAQQDDQAAAGTPAPVFPFSCLTGNATVGAINNAATAAPHMTEPTGWAERFDNLYATPANGLEVVTRDSGFTGTTVTWGSSSATVFCSLIAELIANAASAISSPTDIGQNTPVAGSTASTVTFTTTATVPSNGKLMLSIGWAGTPTCTAVSATGCTGAVSVQKQTSSQNFAVAYLDAPSGLASGSTVTATFSAATADSRYICGSYVTGAATGAAASTGSNTSSGTALWDTGNLASNPSAGYFCHGGAYGGTTSSTNEVLTGGFTEIHDFNIAADSVMCDVWRWAADSAITVKAAGSWAPSNELSNTCIASYAPTAAAGSLLWASPPNPTIFVR